MNDSTRDPGSVPPSGPRQSRADQAAQVIRTRIKRGIYTPGTRLPSLRALSSELKLTVPAIQRAIRQLEGEGLLESQHGVGIRILDSADCSSTPLVFGFVQPYFGNSSHSLQHVLEDVLDNRANLCLVKTTHNDPARERREIDRLVGSGIHGLMVWPVDGDENADHIQEIGRKVPTVLVNRSYPTLPTPSVVLDYAALGADLVRLCESAGYRRILVPCDPSDPVRHGQLRSAIDAVHGSVGVAFAEISIARMIEASYAGDYTLADACYAQLRPLLEGCDALFCPQSELFDLVFASENRAGTLAGIDCIALRTVGGTRHSRGYYALGVKEWVLDTPQMLLRAMELLQDMTMSRTTRRRTIKIPILPLKA